MDVSLKCHKNQRGQKTYILTRKTKKNAYQFLLVSMQWTIVKFVQSKERVANVLQFLIRNINRVNFFIAIIVSWNRHHRIDLQGVDTLKIIIIYDDQTSDCNLTLQYILDVCLCVWSTWEKKLQCYWQILIRRSLKSVSFCAYK